DYYCSAWDSVLSDVLF
nr:immunoglobulin light chain junction region [Macaca mulatta]MOV96793.1 immunoglobulin light chain junction region [Macaca mulatta]MOV96846.1 immunoglobulin light chain junction region [Macaca mulatta]